MHLIIVGDFIFSTYDTQIDMKIKHLTINSLVEKVASREYPTDLEATR